jgi:hypothetical protein
LETGVKVGSEVDYTTDLFSNVGRVVLINSDEEILKNDVEHIRRMEENNELFEYKVKDAFLASTIHNSSR